MFSTLKKWQMVPKKYPDHPLLNTNVQNVSPWLDPMTRVNPWNNHQLCYLLMVATWCLSTRFSEKPLHHGSTISFHCECYVNMLLKRENFWTLEFRADTYFSSFNLKSHWYPYLISIILSSYCISTIRHGLFPHSISFLAWACNWPGGTGDGIWVILATGCPKWGILWKSGETNIHKLSVCAKALNNIFYKIITWGFFFWSCILWILNFPSLEGAWQKQAKNLHIQCITC